MRITKIEQDGDIFSVTITPNIIGKFFGIKESVEQFKDTGKIFFYGGGHIYVNKLGEELGNKIGYGCNTREAIDKWRKYW